MHLGAVITLDERVLALNHLDEFCAVQTKKVKCQVSVRASLTYPKTLCTSGFDAGQVK